MIKINSVILGFKLIKYYALLLLPGSHTWPLSDTQGSSFAIAIAFFLNSKVDLPKYSFTWGSA